MRTMKTRGFTGTTDPAVRPYETAHRAVARRAAAEGMVLLKNEGQLLPLAPGAEIALYGPGAVKTIKGGMGSGDVNPREVVNVYQGLKNAGFRILTEDWLTSFETEYETERLRWRQKIWDKTEKMEKNGLGLFDAYGSTPFIVPTGNVLEQKPTKTAVYVLTRTAGEGADRFAAQGDYFLSRQEKKTLRRLCSIYPEVVLVLNVGGIMDLSFLSQLPEIKSVIYMHQPGMEAGNALADILSGRVTPSGKLTDSWALKYEDYPGSKNFSHNNGDVTREYYNEGIYVGYRYFDTFEVPMQYGFGFGLSYTDFTWKTTGIAAAGLGTSQAELLVNVSVTNVGSSFSGREVVQVYSCAPAEKLEKEYRRLAGFAKTKLLAPGETEEVTVHIPVRALASFDPAQSAWVLEEGIYGLYVGNELEKSAFAGAVTVREPVTVAKTKHICPLQEELQELHAPAGRIRERRAEWLVQAAACPGVTIGASDLVEEVPGTGDGFDMIPADIMEFVDSLSTEQLIGLATGEISKGQGSSLGSAGISVPGSAAETGSCAKEQGLAEIVLADGPAGLRLNTTYQVKDGAIVRQPFEVSLENGFLCREPQSTKGTTYYQYCTAFPVGTLLAQTWDPETVRPADGPWPKNCGNSM